MLSISRLSVVDLNKPGQILLDEPDVGGILAP